MTSSSNKPATSMADLMARHSSAFETVKKGEIVTGKITKLEAGEMMLTINGKMEAGVIEKDRRLHKQLMDMVKVGDDVTATVISVESDFGYPLVSLRHFLDEKMWVELDALKKSGAKMSVTVTESTKGGYVVESETGISGFLPNSHLKSPATGEEMVGKKLDASIAEVNRENRKVIFSQKGVMTEDDFKALSNTYKKDQKVSGNVSGVTTFGLFVSLPFTRSNGEATTVDGLVHISEVSWDKTENLSDEFSTGNTVDTVVIGVDSRSKRIDLSIKRLSKDPFQKILEAFPVEKKVTGTVAEINDFGLTIDLGEIDGGTVEGMIKKDKISPTAKYEVGQKVTATVVSVDSRKRKVMLTPVLTEKPLMYR